MSRAKEGGGGTQGPDRGALETLFKQLFTGHCFKLMQSNPHFHKCKNSFLIHTSLKTLNSLHVLWVGRRSSKLAFPALPSPLKHRQLDLTHPGNKISAPSWDSSLPRLIPGQTDCSPRSGTKQAGKEPSSRAQTAGIWLLLCY